MEIKRLSREDYTFVYSKVPRLCVDMIVRNEKGEILLIERTIDPGKGMWHFPGGTVLRGESLLQAMRRILKEETNLDIIESSIIGVMDFYEEDNPYFHTVSNVFEVKTEKGKLSGSFQGENLKYFNRLPEKIIPEQKEFIASYNLI